MRGQSVTTARHMQQTLVVSLVVATYCESLYDALRKISPMLSEKRTLIDVLSIKDGLEVNSQSQVRWIQTSVQLTDGLTKKEVKLQAMLVMATDKTIVRLTDGVSLL